MKSRILITAATQNELDYADTTGFKDSLDIDSLITGVGSVATVYSLMNYLRKGKTPDHILNIGIAGSYRSTNKIGDTMIVGNDCFADIGIEEQDGFTGIWDSGLIEQDEFPFKGGKLFCNESVLNLLEDHFEFVKGLTVNSASGREESINRLLKRFDPDIETMEVAAVMYVGALEGIPVIPLRSISNFIEPRNRDAWDLSSALSALKPAINIILTKITG